MIFFSKLRSHYAKKFFSKNKLYLAFLGVSLSFNNTLFAANQAMQIDNKIFQTPRHSFLSKEVWDFNTQNFKKINGINYYGVFKEGLVDGITLQVYNPKTKAQNLQHSKRIILTPDTSNEEIIERQGFHASNSLNKALYPIKMIPFLVAGRSLKADAINNKLILKEGELSSVIFLKPDAANTKDPLNEESETFYNYIITAALAQNADAKNNITELQDKSYVNMGVEDTYTLQLNGAPYLVGGVSILGDSINNTLMTNFGSKVDIHTTPYRQNEIGDLVFDERITHIIGGLAYNGNVMNNEVYLKGVELMMHSPKNSYSSFASAHITGAFVDSDDAKKYDAFNNRLIIEDFSLGLRVDGTEPIFYDAIFWGEFFGGRTPKGNANKNTIILKNIPSLFKESSNVKVQGIYTFFAGYTLDGQANNNTLKVKLKSPLQISPTYLKQNKFGFYGAYANNGASNNKIEITNNLTIIDGTKNQNDRVEVIAGRTLAGSANNNTIIFKDSQVSLPLFVYATQQELFEGSIHYPEKAKNNTIILDNVFGRKDIRSGVEAIDIENTQIDYYNVEAQSSGEGLDKESSMYIKAVEVAKNNIFKARNYWARAQLNAYGIRGGIESTNNQMIFNNVGFSTDRLKEKSGLIIIGGIGNSAYHNILSIKDIEIGEYDQKDDFIYIAASAIPNANSNLALSYANILYIGGDISIHENTLLNAISGSVIRIPSYTASNADIITLPAPSLGQLTEENHLILENHLKARVVNNFEHYSFIYNKNYKNRAFIESLEAPINLSKDSIISLILKNGMQSPKKGSKVPLIFSKNGFSDINGNALNIQQLNDLLKVINENKNTFKYNEIPQLEKNLQIIPTKLFLGDNGKMIYAEI